MSGGLTARYDSIADWYVQGVRGAHGIRFHRLIWPSLLHRLGDLRERRVLDLACGEGFVSRLLASEGALVTGIDLSQALLDCAAAYEREQPLGIVYRRDDATQLATIAD